MVKTKISTRYFIRLTPNRLIYPTLYTFLPVFFLKYFCIECRTSTEWINRVNVSRLQIPSIAIVSSFNSSIFFSLFFLLHFFTVFFYLISRFPIPGAYGILITSQKPKALSMFFFALFPFFSFCWKIK